ncbi:F0F1 ATP synthase subunit B [Manganibacter manganicus]|uniref:ATP synthase subunit b n=1 Tax=Manganibacter manganicus TaxID=1873176 RepID=A0A1V8RQT6_9HYPH|nr:F0F1 ATP synthase subunit B [Pseudaminobacter manganicus]OQM75570.1 ATP F0F1 synthase subunit B' [Pseudaminobacter manganicus]
MFVTTAYAEEAAPAAQAGTEVPHQEGGHESFPPFDATTFPSQLLWLAITFGLFYVFLKKTVVPRIGGVIEERSSRITSDLDQAAKLKDEADAAVAAYEQELAEAKTRANAIGQEARDAAKAEAETARKSVEADLESKLAEAESHIATIKTAAMKDVGAIAESTATAIIERLLGKADKADVAAAVKSAAG